jgi:hypothetical protein
VSDPDQLQSTSFHMLRDEKFFRDTKDIEPGHFHRPEEKIRTGR